MTQVRQQVGHDLSRGPCPCCGHTLISQMYYTTGTGYIIKWVCGDQDCDYVRTI